MLKCEESEAERVWRNERPWFLTIHTLKFMADMAKWLPGVFLITQLYEEMARGFNEQHFVLNVLCGATFALLGVTLTRTAQHVTDWRIKHLEQVLRGWNAADTAREDAVNYGESDSRRD